MMGRATQWLFATSVIVPLTIALGAISASANPLVTGNLIIYYDYDEIDNNQFLDGSGNGFHGTIFQGNPVTDTTPGTLTLETSNVARGTGAARFQQSSTSTDRPVYIDSHGEDITANFPDLLPTSGINGANGYSFSLWANLQNTSSLPGGGSQSLWAARNSNGGFQTHVQKEASGALRMTFRTNGPCCTDVVNTTRFTDGATTDPDSNARVPDNEWFHFAGTYDQPSNTWAMYYNGQQIATASGTGADGGKLGDWGGQKFLGDFLAAGSGTVTEQRNRLVQGLMDELYIFNRALTAEEVTTLYNGVAGLDGDYNGDGSVDAADYVVWRKGGSPDSSEAGYELWKTNFGSTSSGSASSAAVPEPSSIIAVLTCCFLGVLTARQNMKRK